MKHENTISSSISFLQSRAWADFQSETLQKKTARVVAGALSGTIIRSPVGYGNYYAYAPHGPSGTYNKESLLAFIEETKKNTLLKNAFFLRIEPFVLFSESLSETLTRAGFRKSAHVQPEETIVLDLTPPEEDILKKMEHNTRYSIRAAARRGVSVVSFSGDEAIKNGVFEVFCELFRETNRRHGLRSYSEDYYRGVTSLRGDCFSKMYVAYHGDAPIAAAIVVFFGERATYLYAASRAGVGNLNAPTLLVWEAIRDAKNSGCVLFDFWGASATKKEWAGVTAFKKSFGGDMIHYAGTWDYPYVAAKYFAYRTLKKIL